MALGRIVFLIVLLPNFKTIKHRFFCKPCLERCELECGAQTWLIVTLQEAIGLSQALPCIVGLGELIKPG